MRLPCIFANKLVYHFKLTILQSRILIKKPCIFGFGQNHTTINSLNFKIKLNTKEQIKDPRTVTSIGKCNSNLTYPSKEINHVHIKYNQEYHDFHLCQLLSSKI